MRLSVRGRFEESGVCEVVVALFLSLPGSPSWKRRRTPAGLAVALLLVFSPDAADSAPAPDHPLFRAPFLSFNVGADAASVAAGDLDNDGHPDLVVANGARTVSVYPGLGDGMFGPGASYDSGSGPYATAAADLDGDGALDLVVTNVNDSTLSVLLGRGDGTFAPKRDYPAGPDPYSVAIADLNGDGKADVAVGNWRSETIAILLGNGDGTFEPRRETGKVDWPASVAVGDLDADGNPDLIAACDQYPGIVSVLLGRGDGTFGPAVRVAAGRSIITTVAPGDLNGDGILDLAAAQGGCGHFCGAGISVLLGNGDGTFQAPGTFQTGVRPLAVSIADLNGDGKPDVVTANSESSTISVLMGTGDGSFGPTTEVATGYGPSSLTVADLNGDGELDLIAATRDWNQSSPGAVSVHLGNGDGTFGARDNYQVLDRPGYAVLADLGGDERPDLVATSVSEGVLVYPGNGDGTFGARTLYPAGPGSGPIAVGDLNGDGTPDLVVANSKDRTISVFAGNGDGTFGTRQDTGVERRAWYVALGDLDGDGKPDLVLAGRDTTISVLRGNGDGTFGPMTRYDAGGQVGSVAIGDLDGDGRPDLAAAVDGPAPQPQYRASVFPGNGDGTFGARRDIPVPGFLVAVLFSDANRDGKPDLVAVGMGGSVLVVPGTGRETSAPGDGSTPAASSSGAAIADLNGDGIPDLALATFNFNTVSVRLGGADGTFAPAFDYGTAGGPGSQPLNGGACSVSVGDLNGDGKPDLVAANRSLHTVTALLNIGTPPPPPPAALQALAPRPNPSRHVTTLQFLLPAAGVVSADILDVAGRKVRSLDSDRELAPGEQSLAWDGRDSRGWIVPAGVYFARIRSGREVVTAKLVRLK